MNGRNSTMEFTDCEKDKLIDWVKANPQLYNAKHVIYSDIKSKKLLWEDIGRSLNKSGM